MAAVIAGLLGFTECAVAFETKASEALLIDVHSGAVLFSKDADKPFAPAALAKLMTMEVVFKALKDGELTLDDAYPVSENAWRTGGAPSGGSTMFAALKSKIPLRDLIQGVIVQSANDGAIVIAEGLSGSEEKFAERMNERARAIGLTASVFRNASGLPAEGQAVTARDLVTLASHIQKTYPDFYKIYAQPEFTWNKIRQRNRNPLLAMNIGADGMGTGYTEGSGYAIVGSVSRGGRRVIAAMGGMASERERAEEARKLLDWGLDGFRLTNLFAANEIVGGARVYGGEKPIVLVKAEYPVTALVPAENQDLLTARIVYDGPVAAPVEQGAPIGRLEIWAGETLSRQVPLVAAEPVALGRLHRRALDAVSELAIGWMR
ncbi:D-alanyl-D-alanine carboxypeptidase family protein [Mesorhizobium sp. LHD-90]|nr:D-alanyl-D-alanine carboxypeptidase family protein [Mesorhizobium sp. LHD-90]MDQ6438040.1 D-alanyl-D-alanine carboxypeptidase family protein [Mesorhizobium sp. LHD-90]